MNNKGFAITTILYGTLILFMLLLVSMLGILSTYKDRLSKLVDSNNGARDIINNSNNSSDVDDFEYEQGYDYDEDIPYYEFVVPVNGKYKLEVWGAQGGDGNSRPGGYGGYSTGVVSLEKDEVLYIYVGGKGENGSNSVETTAGGYNGGGQGKCTASYYVGGGGGATHIATKEGLLKDLSSTDDIDKILIVAGGGGGSAYLDSDARTYQLGCGGGYIGRTATGSTSDGTNTTSDGGMQTAAGTTGAVKGSFGQGANGDSSGKPGGGGGLWGGNTSAYAGAGGSGYIGNSRLTDKKMYCFGCTESSETETFTISVSGDDSKKEEPTEGSVKLENGYARITYIG